MRIWLEVEVTHIAGKFAPKDEVEQEIVGLIEGNTLYASDSEYEVDSVNVLDAKMYMLKRRLARQRKAAQRARLQQQPGTTPVVQAGSGEDPLTEAAPKELSQLLTIRKDK